MISMVKKGKINICKLVLGELRTNCYIVYGENKEGFLVDPAAEWEIIKIKVTDLGVTIKAILLTHGHFDHIMAGEQMRKNYEAKIYALDKEKVILESSDNNLSGIFTSQGVTLRADEYLTDGQILTIGDLSVKVIATPGHTIGSACYLVSNDSDSALLSGDTLFRGSCGRYDFPTGSYSQIVNSIKEKLLVLDDKLEVFAGHNEETTIGEEKD